MKTATEAKTIALSAKTQKATSELQEIFTTIEKAAEAGNLTVAVKIKHNTPESIIPQIEAQGYSVTQEFGLVVIDWS